MKISVIDLSSDSSDNEEMDRNSSGSKFTGVKNSNVQSASKFFCENEQHDVESRVPLFKIIFKDESTSRIYRKKLIDIIDYLVSANLSEDSESNSGDLVLEIYEPTDNAKTVNFDTTANLSGISLVDDNQNYSVAFNFEKKMEMERVEQSGINSRTDRVVSNILFNQIIEPNNNFGVYNWEMQQCPQGVQQSTFQPVFSLPENLNIKKRKRVDDSDSSIQAKQKKRMECTSECPSDLQNESDTLDNPEINGSKAPYYDPVWYNSNNTQSTMTEGVENTETNASRILHYNAIWYNSNKQNTSTENVPLENTKDACPQESATESEPQEKTIESSPQLPATNTLVMNEKSSTTFTYRVLKIGTFDYTTKRTFSISKDGIQLCAHHLSKTLSVVKVNIEIANIIKLEASFSQILPALFLYINDQAATTIKEAIGMSNDSVAYIDPQSSDESCNKVIILPDHMPENSRVLKNLIKVGLINKLDKETADAILLNSFSKTLVRQDLPSQQDPDELLLNITYQSVRIGTYKSSSIRFNVMISVHGFLFQIPTVGDDENHKTINVDFKEIDKLYFSLKKVSALFLHVNSDCAQRIRSLIEMSETDTKKVYFDPDSENIAEKRLVIVFNKIKPHQQETLRTLLSYTQSAEISLDKIIHQMLFNHM